MKPTQHTAISSKAGKAAETDAQDFALAELNEAIQDFFSDHRTETSSWSFSTLRYAALLSSAANLVRVDISYSFDISLARFTRFLYDFASEVEEDRKPALIQLLRSDLNLDDLLELVLNAYSVSLRAAKGKVEDIPAQIINEILTPDFVDVQFFDFLIKIKALKDRYQKVYAN